MSIAITAALDPPKAHPFALGKPNADPGLHDRRQGATSTNDPEDQWAIVQGKNIEPRQANYSTRPGGKSSAPTARAKRMDGRKKPPLAREE